MPKLNKQTIEEIRRLDCKVLQDIVIAHASKDKSFYNYVYVNYLDKETGEQDLFEKVKNELDYIFSKEQDGYVVQLRLANMLDDCIETVNEFSKVSKNKVLEADLLLYILDVAFEEPENVFGTCFAQFDRKVGIILRRLITIVTKKIHEDYRIEYVPKINEYVVKLKRTSNHLNSIYNINQIV